MTCMVSKVETIMMDYIPNPNWFSDFRNCHIVRRTPTEKECFLSRFYRIGVNLNNIGSKLSNSKLSF